ncbi:hypothetical protein [Blautia wexlerae]|uniref:hypothetical protein n=1 Tax=Blautia wexlerae TaxID=418240 RepID=UPI0022E53E2F|nr:hypothetical protein [Blautia wexlerae]
MEKRRKNRIILSRRYSDTRFRRKKTGSSQRTGIAKHLQTCKKRVDLYEKAKKTEKYFELLLYGAYNKDYWLIIQIKENATLDDLDRFIRDIWVECCGHLSVFEIDGVSYEREPDDDFGSTTEIMVKVLDHYSAQKQNEKVVILSRNNPPEFACSICGNSRSLKRESFFINPTIFPLCKTIQDNLDSGNISLF